VFSDPSGLDGSDKYFEAADQFAANNPLLAHGYRSETANPQQIFDNNMAELRREAAAAANNQIAKAKSLGRALAQDATCCLYKDPHPDPAAHRVAPLVLLALSELIPSGEIGALLDGGDDAAIFDGAGDGPTDAVPDGGDGAGDGGDDAGSGAGDGDNDAGSGGDSGNGDGSTGNDSGDRTTPQTVYASGKSPNGPNASVATPRPWPSDFGPGTTPSTIVGPGAPPTPQGMSTYDSIPNLQDNLSGPQHVYELPQGSPLPDGVDFAPDGGLTGPDGAIPDGHVTIYPTDSSPFSGFQDLVGNLAWKYLGKM
jgi:hypothetical protein